MNASDPIGIFDSGTGGLTVAHAVTQLLPQENIIYFGDTAHLPYGDKSTAALQTYSVKICDFLLQNHCKLILIACNTAASAAYDIIKMHVKNQAIIVSVIDPIIDLVGDHYPHKHVGLIGTKHTVHSNVYKTKLDALQRGIELHALATPLFVPMIEEGFVNNKITDAVVQQYLTHPTLSEIEALILACTHYPLIKHHINQFYQEKISIIDSSFIVAKEVKAQLAAHTLLNTSEQSSLKKFYVSDYTEFFAHSASRFFGEAIKLELYPLWT